MGRGAAGPRHSRVSLPCAIPSPPMTRLALRGITHRFGAQTVLADVALAVEPGEFLVLLGPSGCGKSTLLRIVAGLVAPSAGQVEIDGKVVNDMEPRERDVAMVFQNYALYPHMSVRANLAFPLKMAGVERGERAGRVARAAEVLGLTPLLERKPATLSGGQMQRVALGRALVRNPRLFLFDEPLSNLDARLRAEMRAEIARLHRELGITTLYVTHDQAEAMTMGTRICLLNAGRIEQVGTPLQVFERPASAFVAAFVGSPPMNLLRGRIEGGRFSLGPLALDLPFRDGAAWLGIRPHHVALGEGTALPISFVERLGHETHIHLDLGADGQRLLVACDGARAVPDQGALAVELPPGKLHGFDPDTGRRL